MFKLDPLLVQAVSDRRRASGLFRGQFGLEKENVRIDSSGKMARSPHPSVFGDKSKNPFITTDFSESQVEMITPPMKSVEEAYDFLDSLQNLVSLNLEEEFLWPQSLPPVLPQDKHIPIADFSSHSGDDLHEATAYRHLLAEKYGRKKQLISGIHYNFSFDDALLRALYEAGGEGRSYRSFRNDMYMKVIRNMTGLSWMLIRLVGSSPAADSSYLDYCHCHTPDTEGGDFQCDSAASIRNGQCGYRNHFDYDVSLKSLEDYVSSLEGLINEGELISSKEYYNAIRPKNSRGGLKSLREEGIEYLELRILDINPLFKLGVCLEDLKLVHLFFLFSLFMEEGADENLLSMSIQNNRTVADQGRKANLEIRTPEGLRPAGEVLKEFFSLMRDTIVSLPAEHRDYMDVLAYFDRQIEDPDLSYSSRLVPMLRREGFIAFHLRKAKESLELSRREGFRLIGHEDMELSTQILILDALKRGVAVEILDRKENFIRLSKEGHVEYVKQATKTRADSYSSVLLMENKLVTKKVLRQSGIRVPGGNEYACVDEAFEDYRLFRNRQIVVKPNSTNFGTGITIFVEPFTEEEYREALDLAFKHDETVLVEEFIQGKEYRVFVIGDEVVGVLHRVPANVLGDGTSTIRELIDEKNKDPKRGRGYRTPLELIRTGQEEEMFLHQQNLGFQSIPASGQLVYLRENSNISTGGDSIDYSDEISDELKEVALEASRAVGARIVGVDLMTRNIAGGREDYSIIELNFNPAIHIHCYPMVGQNRHLGDKILDLLGFQLPVGPGSSTES